MAAFPRFLKDTFAIAKRVRADMAAGGPEARAREAAEKEARYAAFLNSPHRCRSGAVGRDYRAAVLHRRALARHVAWPGCALSPWEALTPENPEHIAGGQSTRSSTPPAA